MHNNNEYGAYMTSHKNKINYDDNGKEIIITSSWNSLPTNKEIYEEKIKYLYKIPERLAFCLTKNQKDFLQNKINKIKPDKLQIAAGTLNSKSFRLIDWFYTMDLFIPKNYTYNGFQIYSDLIIELNKFIDE